MNLSVCMTVFLLTLFLSCHDVTSVVDGQVDGITFYDVRGIYSTAHTPILSIQRDLQQQDSLLIADYNSLKVLDRNNIEHLIVGQTTVSGFRDGQGAQALFTWITSLIQLSSSTVLAVDHYNHCIRSVNRNSNTTTTFAGICENGGHNDQNLALSRFYNPYDIVQSPSSTTVFYVSDEYNNAVRRLSGSTVTTMARNGVLFKPRGLAFDQTSHNLYITIRHGIVKMRVSTGRVTALTLSSSGHADGPLATAMFSNPYMIKRLTPTTFVAADYGNNLLRLVNTANSRVTSLCTGIKGKIDGSIHNCQLYEPYAVEVFIDDRKILIGEWGDIKALNFQFSNQTTTSTSTTVPATTTRPKTTTKITTKLPDTSPTHPTEIVTTSIATTPLETGPPSTTRSQMTENPTTANPTKERPTTARTTAVNPATNPVTAPATTRVSTTIITTPTQTTTSTCTTTTRPKTTTKTTTKVPETNPTVPIEIVTTSIVTTPPPTGPPSIITTPTQTTTLKSPTRLQTVVQPTSTPKATPTTRISTTPANEVTPSNDKSEPIVVDQKTTMATRASVSSQGGNTTVTVSVVVAVALIGLAGLGVLAFYLKLRTNRAETQHNQPPTILARRLPDRPDEGTAVTPRSIRERNLTHDDTQFNNNERVQDGEYQVKNARNDGAYHGYLVCDVGENNPRRHLPSDRNSYDDSVGGDDNYETINETITSDDSSLSYQYVGPDEYPTGGSH